MKIKFKASSLEMAKLRTADKYYPGSIKVNELKKPTKDSLGKYSANYKLKK